jgi:hypothetical protein
MKTKAWQVWLGLAIIAFVGTVFALMKSWAAADLGRETMLRDQALLSGWCVTTVSLCLSALVFVALTIRSWPARRRSLHLKAEQ